MSKREQYGLLFNKIKTQEGEMIHVVNWERSSNTNPILTMVGLLDKHDVESFIDDLDRCITGQSNADEGFFSDSVDNRDILYQYPNVNIDGILIISMVEMKALLEEWLVFLNT